MGSLDTFSRTDKHGTYLHRPLVHLTGFRHATLHCEQTRDRAAESSGCFER
jgi:hypothetical protein